jgi:hypothetical protein
MTRDRLNLMLLQMLATEATYESPDLIGLV